MSEPGGSRDHETGAGQRHYAWPQKMGDGIWRAVCVCGWRGEATNDIAASWEANNHGPKPSSLSCEMQRTLGLEPTPDVSQVIADRAGR